MATPGQQVGGIRSTLIGDICEETSGITITARVTNKSRVRTKENRYEDGSITSTDWLFFECEDASGEIRCVAFYEKAWEFNRIQINEVYTITNLETQRRKDAHRRALGLVIGHNFELLATDVSQIRLIPRSDSQIFPYRKYKFEEISGLKRSAGTEVTIVDVIGVCVEMGEVEQKDTEWGPKKMRELRLVDQTAGPSAAEGITLTLWGEPADEVPRETPFAVIVKRAKLVIFNMEPRLQSGDANLMQIDPDLPETKTLMEWYNQAA